MTREEFDNKISKCYSGSEAHTVCNKHIAHLEAKLKAKDKEISALIHRVADITKENVEANNRIAELEANLKPKTCDGCKYEEDKRGGNCYAFSSCSRDSFDHYTPKERG